MANVRLESINKFYSEVHALKNLTLEVADKEFLVIVGPSGSGKTTLLRILAGLENPSSGDVFVDDQRVTDTPTANRDIAMVFQSYSLYPHLNVWDNLSLALQNRAFTEKERDVYYLTKCLLYGLLVSVLALFSIVISFFLSYGLRLLGLVALWLFFFATISFHRLRNRIEREFLRLFGKRKGTLSNYMKKEQEISEQISSTAELLEIQSLLKRKPSQLSGGQRQRVALGRAIIRKPKAFLMDEPLSNLDAKLRSAMRAEIAELQRKLQITTVYVTHDQTEAMTLGHRIVILNDGKIEQIGSPHEVYSEPSNVFVASFIGNPPMNLIQGTLNVNERNEIVFDFHDGKIVLFLASAAGRKIPTHLEEDIVLGIRPEHLTIMGDSEPSAVEKTKPTGIIKGTITHVESLGATTQIHLRIGTKTRIVVSFEGYRQFTIGAGLSVGISPNKVYFFDAKTELRTWNLASVASRQSPNP